MLRLLLAARKNRHRDPLLFRIILLQVRKHFCKKVRVKCRQTLKLNFDELRPGELWITHGREEALARWAELNGIAARPLSLVGYEDEDV